ncbi:MAG TPA: di-heme oxidoredictase family protein [Candidatus Binatia bacterium]|nr:di-heme oxidoredictase family protein [Candidatus Binatia bacterium]
MTPRRCCAAAPWPLLALCVALAAGCSRAPEPEAATWPADCPSLDRPPPLSLAAARDAQRSAERRHEIRLREAAEPGFFLRGVHATLDAKRLAAGKVCLSEVDDLGELLFEHEYGYADGLGGGASKTSRRGPFRRVHDGLFGGPETASCTSCHWIGGPSGAGAETDDAFLDGDGDRIGSGDARNPPALVGLGVVQALAREMTADLQRQRADLVRDAARAGAGREMRLTAKGVDFGVLRASADGKVDASGIRGVDGDLVVKPFGWKGTLPRIADFSSEALQVHIGIQSDELLATGARELVGTGSDPSDPDGDGMRGELGQGPFTAMIAHLAVLELPVVEPLIQDRVLPAPASSLLPPTTTSFAVDFQRGRDQFHAIGCAGCHQPMMVLESPILKLDGLPPIDLSRQMRQPGLRWDATVHGYPVWLFSDLKRHDMGPANAARHVQRGVAREEYLTPRLWGVADSAPYLHDGRAPSFDYAIAGHDGEGAASRAAYAELPYEEKGALRVYLMSLRRAPRVIVP